MSIRDLTPWILGSKAKFLATDESFRLLRAHMDRLFDEMMGGFDLAPLGHGPNGGLLAPRIDVSEDEKKYRFTAELPGVSEKDVEVTLSDNVLTIKGEKKVEAKKEAEGKSIRLERSYGSFQRSFALPADIDHAKVDASFDKGVLTIGVAKNKEAKAKTKKIEVKAA